MSVERGRIALVTGFPGFIARRLVRKLIASRAGLVPVAELLRSKKEAFLASHTDQKISLADFKGRNTIVSFLPFAFTGG